jgi:hypothetical protein
MQRLKLMNRHYLQKIECWLSVYTYHIICNFQTIGTIPFDRTCYTFHASRLPYFHTLLDSFKKVRLRLVGLLHIYTSFTTSME